MVKKFSIILVIQGFFSCCTWILSLCGNDLLTSTMMDWQKYQMNGSQLGY